MDHRRHEERERQPAQVERVAFLDFERRTCNAVEALDHLQGLGVADEPDVGITPPQGVDRRRVVGLHVVDDQVVDFAVADFAADVLEQAAAEAFFDGVDQGDALADDQIGVVRNACGQGPQGLETGGGAVVDTHVADAGLDFRDIHGR